MATLKTETMQASSEMTRSWCHNDCQGIPQIKSIPLAHQIKSNVNMSNLVIPPHRTILPFQLAWSPSLISPFTNEHTIYKDPKNSKPTNSSAPLPAHLQKQSLTSKLFESTNQSFNLLTTSTHLPYATYYHNIYPNVDSTLSVPVDLSGSHKRDLNFIAIQDSPKDSAISVGSSSSRSSEISYSPNVDQMTGADRLIYMHPQSISSYANPKKLKKLWITAYSNEISNPDGSNSYSSYSGAPYDSTYCASKFQNSINGAKDNLVNPQDAKNKRKSEESASGKASPKKQRPDKNEPKKNSVYLSSEQSTNHGTSLLTSKRGRKPNRYYDEEPQSTSTSLIKKPKKSAKIHSKIENINDKKTDEIKEEGHDEACIKTDGEPVTPNTSKIKKQLVRGPIDLQETVCCELQTKLPKCRECRTKKEGSIEKNFCRFYHYRKLRRNKNGSLTPAGFCQPDEAKEEDVKIWLPSAQLPTDLDIATCKYLLQFVGDQFCHILMEEKRAEQLHYGGSKKRTWKKVVKDVREMCDVCDTTLFNFHWVCHKCGFDVCIDCFAARRDSNPSKDKDQFKWLTCHKEAHEPKELYLTQIVAKDSLSKIGALLHSTRTKLGIPQECGCVNKPISAIGGSFNMAGAPSYDKPVHNFSNYDSGHSSPLSFLAEIALQDGNSKLSCFSNGGANIVNGCNKAVSYGSIGEANGSTFSTLRGILTSNEVDSGSHLLQTNECIKNSVSESNKENSQNLEYYTPSYQPSRRGWDYPIATRDLNETKALYPNVSHSWFCEGRLLVLHDPQNEENVSLFQEQWKRGQPVLVNNVHLKLDKEIWTPKVLSEEMKDEKVNLVNCLTNHPLKRQTMCKFWKGFESLEDRPKDKEGKPIILKVKDWPEHDDFGEILPKHFKDLMKNLPLPEYTTRTGKLNLASRLPEDFLRPDLGPKMYNAYGTSKHPDKATTNLHLDISDAINVMIYVGIPHDDEQSEEMRLKEMIDVATEAGCDSNMIDNLKEKAAPIGAIWHIYNARDANMIRDLLNKVAKERGEELEPNHDPIHDQDWYLSHELRMRLKSEYNVEGYAIAQCLGDAIMIPAGAPHQVRNINSCVKVAGDFVSPENITQCFNLTQEFRQLSSKHSNHADKLQIKNIIYHAIKDAAGVLSQSLTSS